MCRMTLEPPCVGFTAVPRSQELGQGANVERNETTRRLVFDGFRCRDVTIERFSKHFLLWFFGEDVHGRLLELDFP